MSKFKILSVLFITIVALAGCGGSGGGGSSSGGSSVPDYVGSWSMDTVDGVDVASSNAVFTLTTSSFISSSTDCTSSGTSTISETLYSVTLTATDCSDKAVGDTFTGTFVVSGTSATMTCSSSNCDWSNATLTKTSS